MSNQDIADALFVDEDDMAQLATQNELFKLIGVTDGDPRYSDVLLIADWHTRKLDEAVRYAMNDAKREIYEDCTLDEVIEAARALGIIDRRIAELEGKL